MRTKILIADSIGKTIAKVVNNGSHPAAIVVAFTDETFSVISIEFGYENGDEELQDDDEFTEQCLSDASRIALGWSTEKDLAFERRERHEASVRSLKESKRREYLRLKAEFEGKDE